MKKPVLLAITFCALGTSLASCGIKNKFSIKVDDPVRTYSQAGMGFVVSLVDGYKLIENPNPDNVKFTWDKEGEVPFRFDVFDNNDPSKDTWKIFPDNPGVYKLSMSIGGVKSENELVLTVKDTQYADDSFALPENVHIQFKYNNGNIRDVYKIGSSYVIGRGGNFAEAYAPDISAEFYYANKGTEGANDWISRNRDPKGVIDLGMTALKINEKGEYITKEEGSLTIGETTYQTVIYNYSKDVIYNCIRTEDLKIVGKLQKGNQTAEVITIDRTITKFPDVLGLPSAD